jgi:hypothetical protein
MPKQRSGDLVGLRRHCRHFDSETNTTLLHLSRPDLDIESASHEERLAQWIEVLGTQIVQIRGQEDDLSCLNSRSAEN